MQEQAGKYWVFISIHALREEGDCCFCVCIVDDANFYPRPPRGGRRSSGRERSAAPNFYPRPPRGGRPRGKLRACGRGDFYPRPPRGGRLIRRFSSALSNNFYPRPPRGGRHPLWTIPNLYTKFLSTPSARRATYQSIWAVADTMYFYPRPPRGGRQLAKKLNAIVPDISIHALREEGDCRSSSRDSGKVISIHALREEGDEKTAR